VKQNALAKKIVVLLPDHETLTTSKIVKLTNGKPSTVKLQATQLIFCKFAEAVRGRLGG
jgi:hypothetical protein